MEVISPWQKNVFKSPSRTWQETYERENREQLLFSDAICSLSLDFALDGGRLLKSDNLFLFIIYNHLQLSFVFTDALQNVNNLNIVLSWKRQQKFKEKWITYIFTQEKYNCLNA